jgi:hypothetical protein
LRTGLTRGTYLITAQLTLGGKAAEQVICWTTLTRRHFIRRKTIIPRPITVLPRPYLATKECVVTCWVSTCTQAQWPGVVIGDITIISAIKDEIETVGVHPRPPITFTGSGVFKGHGRGFGIKTDSTRETKTGKTEVTGFYL